MGARRGRGGGGGGQSLERVDDRGWKDRRKDDARDSTTDDRRRNKYASSHDDAEVSHVNSECSTGLWLHAWIHVCTYCSRSLRSFRVFIMYSVHT